MSVELIQIYAFLVFVISIAYTVIDIKVRRSLSERDAQIFKEIGSPGLFNTTTKYRFVYRFLMLSGYKEYELSDHSKRLCEASQKVCWLLHVIGIGWLIIIFM